LPVALAVTLFAKLRVGQTGAKSAPALREGKVHLAPMRYVKSIHSLGKKKKP